MIIDRWVFSFTYLSAWSSTVRSNIASASFDTLVICESVMHHIGARPMVVTFRLAAFIPSAMPCTTMTSSSRSFGSDSTAFTMSLNPTARVGTGIISRARNIIFSLFISILQVLPPRFRDGVVKFKGIEFNIVITTCEECGGNIKVIASIENPAVITQIHTHLQRKPESKEFTPLPGCRVPYICCF